MIMIAAKKVEEPEIENAHTTYEFCCSDLNEGLNYGISEELYNRCMGAVSSKKRISGGTDNETFCNDFYEECMKGE